MTVTREQEIIIARESAANCYPNDPEAQERYVASWMFAFDNQEEEPCTTKS